MIEGSFVRVSARVPRKLKKELEKGRNKPVRSDSIRVGMRSQRKETATSRGLLRDVDLSRLANKQIFRDVRNSRSIRGPKAR